MAQPSTLEGFVLHRTAATTLFDVSGCCEVLFVSTEELTRLTPEDNYFQATVFSDYHEVR
jgi:hypothetical protein